MSCGRAACFLQQQGHQATVVDRQAAAAAETSVANGGQTSVSHAEPRANPGAPLKLLQWLRGLQFLRECTPARTRHNIRRIVPLGSASRSTLQQLRAEPGLQCDQRAQGILHVDTGAKAFDAAHAPAAPMCEPGCDRRVISADEAGDARQFTPALAARCAQAGVRFLFHHGITALRTVGAAIDHVEATGDQGRFQRLRADDGHTLVCSRLGDRLRIAGTAELNGDNRGLNAVRCQAIVRRVAQLFPGAGDSSRAEFRAGLRPTTPSNLPVIGRSRLSNLFFNTGLPRRAQVAVPALAA